MANDICQESNYSIQVQIIVKLNYSKVDYEILHDSNSKQVEIVISHYIIVDGEANMILKCINRGIQCSYKVMQFHLIHPKDYN